MKRLLLISLLGISSGCFGKSQTGSTANEEARLRVVLSTTFGKPVGKAVAFLRAIGPSAEYEQASSNILFDRLPYGLYELEIQAAGFSKRQERVAIYQPEVSLRIGLVVSPGHLEKRSQIRGALVHSDTNPGTLWVRLVPQYSSDFFEDDVTAKGTFNFTDVPPGRYVLLVFSTEGLALAKQVEYVGGNLKLTRDLNK